MFNAGGCGKLYVFMNSPHLPQPKTDLREVRAVAPRGYGGAAAPQTSRMGVTATFDIVDKYELLIKVLMEPPALFILQQNVLARKHYLEIIKMALNNVRRDSWFQCKIKDGKEKHSLTRGWSKSIRKRKARHKAVTQCLLPDVSLPGENMMHSCYWN